MIHYYFYFFIMNNFSIIKNNSIIFKNNSSIFKNNSLIIDFNLSNEYVTAFIFLIIFISLCVLFYTITCCCNCLRNCCIIIIICYDSCFSYFSNIDDKEFIITVKDNSNILFGTVISPTILNNIDIIN